MGYLFSGFRGHAPPSCSRKTESGRVVTTQYPDESSDPSPSDSTAATCSNRYEDGMEKLHRVRAVRRSVPGPLHLRPRRRQPARRSSVAPGERYGYVYEINYLRCIHCDLCVEACPTEAITESKMFEFSFTNAGRRHLHQRRAVGGRRRPAPAASLGGLEARVTTSTLPAWVRATVTVGLGADYEGQVAWSGELGYGIRVPREGPDGRR